MVKERFSICVVIPNFNHGQVIHHAVAAMLAHGLPCLIVDDASDEVLKQPLYALQNQAGVVLIELPRNLGKGGAVVQGFREAKRLGFTHVLQMDADGQHDARDIKIFVEQARANPGALVVGQPIYDASMPRGRKIARNITHFWVAVETLTLSPWDSMCGFRVYPLEPFDPILQTVSLGKRMDFDIEILVRAIWQNIPIIPIPTKVIYPPEGSSHFHYVRDNLLISLMHTRLFLGMLPRAWRLLQQSNRSYQKPEKHWSDIKEAGGVHGIKFLLFLYKILGRSVVLPILSLVTAWFWLRNRQARLASLSYWSKLYIFSGKDARHQPGCWKSYRHFVAFSHAALDELRAWMGEIKRNTISFPAEQELLALASRGQGALFISAHLGNIEVSRAASRGVDGVHMNAVMFTRHAQKFNRIVEKINQDVQKEVIFVNEVGADTAIYLKQKIDAGEMLVILGDRTPAQKNDRTVSVCFLGHPALFPQGPFILAKWLECPVFLLFCFKTESGYEVVMEPFSSAIEYTRNTRDLVIQAACQRYADRLAHYCQRYPLQWFNFFDFWDADQSRHAHE